ncbi:MAG TPA: hypothetical protein VF166_14895 [Gemmatimonadaceae bacterium]
MRFFHCRALLMAGGALLALAACSQDLTIPNTNDPSFTDVVSTPADVAKLAKSAINTWHDANNEVTPAMSQAVMADALSGGYNNFGMNLSSHEPRMAIQNVTTAGDYTAMVQDPWDRNYKALSEANDVLRALAGGMVIDDDATTESYKALAMLTQGLALGNIALIFDRGFIVDENTKIPAPVSSLTSHQDVEAAALAKLDAAIALAQGKSWTLPHDALPVAGIDLTADNIAKIANTMAARIVAYSPRNSQENQAADWAKVLQYAQNGISSGAAPFDLAIQEDNGTLWWDGLKAYGDYGPWLRVDMRIMHEINPKLPTEYTSCSSIPEDSVGVQDARYWTDFTYIAKIPNWCARGVWHYSNWEYSRYGTKAVNGDVSWYSGTFTGVAPLVLAAENDLLEAEALVRTGGDLNLAANLVNKTRVGRGKLPPVTADPTALLDAIHYEQDVELLTTGAGLAWYNRRRIDGLQAGTPRQFPIPAHELETDGLPSYTFGGPDNPDM